MQVDLTPVFTAALAAAAGALDVSSAYTVLDSVVTPAGKYPALLGNVVVLEAQYVALLVRDTLQSTVASMAATLGPVAAALPPGNAVATTLAALAASAASFDYGTMQGFAMQIAVMADPDTRNSMYISGSLDELAASVTHFADGVMRQLGTTSAVSISAPLSAAMDGVLIISLFLNQIFNVTVFILGLLGKSLRFSVNQC